MIKSESILNVVVFDVETTGLYPGRGDRIIEIGAIRIKDDSCDETFHSLVATKRRISAEARAIHGIDASMLHGMPGPDEIMPRFQAFIGNSLLVAHNARFDIEFLRREFHRQGLGFSNPHACTLRLSKRLCPSLPDHSLRTVYQHLCGSIPTETRPHRALDDARLAAEIWLKMTTESPADQSP